MKAGPDILSVDRTADGVAFWIHVTPRARVARIGGRHGDALRVAVSEPPVDGRANAACQRGRGYASTECAALPRRLLALSEALGLRRRQIAIDPSSRGRRKRVQAGGDSAELAARLRELAAAQGVG